MKIILFIIILFGSAIARERWLSGTAHTLQKGQWEVGLFQPVRWGQGNSREFSFYKVTSFFMPNLKIKQQWVQRGGWTISTSHSFYYPTPLLKKLQSPLGMDVGAPNMFALISPEFHIPHMLSFGNLGLASKQLAGNKILTLKAGLSFAFRSSDLARETTIDLPLIYHRLAVYYSGFMGQFGIDINGQVGEKWNYLLDGDVFLVPKMKGSFSIEHKGLLRWKGSQAFSVLFGYKAGYGLYPDGYPNNSIARFHLFPFFDLQWHKD